VLAGGGLAIAGVDDLHRLLTADRAGSELPVELLRAGRVLTLGVTPEADS
jgi:hypothetical protein